MTTTDDGMYVEVPSPAERAIEALLDDWLDGTANELDPADDQDQADRLLGALRRLRQRRAEVKAVAQARIEQVQAWHADTDGALADREEHLTGLLAGWAHMAHEATSRKTWKLPAGELRVRPRMVTAEWAPDGPVETQIDQVAGYVPSAVETTRSVKPGQVKRVAVPGTRWPERDHLAPEGRCAYTALVYLPAEEQGGEARTAVVPGVVLFVPEAGRAGRQFTAVTK